MDPEYPGRPEKANSGPRKPSPLSFRFHVMAFAPYDGPRPEETGEADIRSRNLNFNFAT